MHVLVVWRIVAETLQIEIFTFEFSLDNSGRYALSAIGLFINIGDVQTKGKELEGDTLECDGFLSQFVSCQIKMNKKSEIPFAFILM